MLKVRPRYHTIYAKTAPALHPILIVLMVLALLSNGVNLLLPILIARGIDSYSAGNFVQQTTVIQFLSAAFFIFVVAYGQSIAQTYASERVARDLRTQLADKISRQTFTYVQQSNPDRLLTNMTSDVDSVKSFVSQAIVSIVSSGCIIIGASILLLRINWQLGLTVLAIVPIIGTTFFFVLKKVRVLFTKSREVIDWLNKVINESILGASQIRVLNSQPRELGKFTAANTDAKSLGIQTLRLFAFLIPTITFTANLAGLAILILGGRFVIDNQMSLGDFAAFNSYLAMLVFPIIIIGFMSNVIAQAQASYTRISVVLDRPDPPPTGTVITKLQGNIEVSDVSLFFGEKPALQDISFLVKASSRTAIVGPTTAGKSQLLYVMTGLLHPKTGEVQYDERPITDYDETSFHEQVALVFQDSILFNLSLRENIISGDKVSEALLNRAIDTAELGDFVRALPDGLETMVSERGGSLSGGQKQRIMLARALALNPGVLFLDDFTARVDLSTEQKIREKLSRNYPGITLISVTQQIDAVSDYEQLILLMEGRILAKGTHEELLASSLEYVQLYQSQRTTSQV